MATPTIGGPLNVKGNEATPPISDAAHTYFSAGKQLELKVSFEEYIYYASITRAEEKLANEAYLNAQRRSTIKSILLGRFQSSRQGHKAAYASNRRDEGPSREIDEKTVQKTSSTQGSSQDVTENQELHTANRALRTAGWGSVFYLITTDILGPSNTPWAFAQTGYGAGFALYMSFGLLSAYSGWILWKMFLGLDSDRYPVRNYADLFLRCFGPSSGYFVHVAQAVQLLMIIAFLILLNGQAISQISQVNGTGPGLCFIVCVLVFALAGMVVGQIRTMQRFSWLANFSVWINLLSMFFVMGLVAHYPPNFGALSASFGPDFGTPAPIQTFAGTPPVDLATGGSGFVASVNGAMQAVFAYGGAMLFPAFMAEMRHPMDFWKGMICAQTFLTSVYLIFGMVVYHFQGQFTFIPIAQGISVYGWQTCLNVLGMVAGLIATGLYSNVGLKIAYVEVLEPLSFPPLTSSLGKVWWACLIPIYWAVGFVLAAAIPQLASISGLFGALFGLGFTYILPAWGALGFFIREDAIAKDAESFDEVSRTYHRVDHGWRRLARGFMKRPVFHVWNLIYLLGTLAACGLGCYASILQLMGAFESGVATSFSCSSPV
ncbi:transmembrane amino acid transporter [Diaporthe helianthi]|uniref:Transmembrane amino acid transporter n=1 Tax=Diaporthe helianthi TaxID=158607 RepID=A0A2P5HZN2_DIAHE|nr:transmembrane amino acid transporter [Diaporthe helianthi]